MTWPGVYVITGLGRWVLNSGYSRVAERQADDFMRWNACMPRESIPSGFEEFFTPGARWNSRHTGGRRVNTCFRLSFRPIHSRTLSVSRPCAARPASTGKVYTSGDHQEWRRLPSHLPEDADRTAADQDPLKPQPNGLKNALVPRASTASPMRSRAWT